MALFKISKGDSSKLGVQPLYEGHAWFTPDDGKFYIDAFVKQVVNNTEQDVLTRIPLCADRADYDGDGRSIKDTYSNFYITALKDNTANTISANKTYQEIVNAYEAGSNLILEYYDSSFADYPRILPLYSWFGQGENITFGFSGAYNKPTSDASNIDATEVISIMYNQSVGWKVFIDQMVTAVDGETGKITTNAVKFIKQDLTVSQRNQAKENIFAAGIAQTLVKTLPQANAISKFTDDKDYPTLTDSNIYAVNDKLGINTASPTATLTVAGDASISSNLEVNGEVSSNTLKLAVASGSKSFVMDTTGTNGGMSIGFVLNTGSKQNLILEGINDKVKIKNLATISDSDDKTYVANKEYVDNQFNKFVGENPTQDLQYIKRKDGVGTGTTTLEELKVSGNVNTTGSMTANSGTFNNLEIIDRPGVQKFQPTDANHLANKAYVDAQDENIRSKLVAGTDADYKLPYIEKENGVGTGTTTLEEALVTNAFGIGRIDLDKNLMIFTPKECEGNNSGANVFGVYGDGNFIIDVNNNIGIGTYSPSSKVHLMGNATIDGSLTVKDNNIVIDNGQVVQPISPTEDSHLANKRYVDASFSANDAMLFKGVIHSALELPFPYQTGWTYKVGTPGSYVGQWCEVGDTIYCVNDSAETATTLLNDDWQVLENNNENVVVRGGGTPAGAVGSATEPVYVDEYGVVQKTKDFNDYWCLSADNNYPKNADDNYQTIIGKSNNLVWNQVNINKKSTTFAVWDKNSSRNGLGYVDFVLDYDQGGVSADGATTQGFYYISSADSTNRPSFKQVDGLQSSDYRILTTAYSDSWLQQFATDFRSNDLFIRRKQQGTWQAWTPILKMQQGADPCPVPNADDPTLNYLPRFDQSRNATIVPSGITIKGDNLLKGLAMPEDGTDAATKSYVDNKVANASMNAKKWSVTLSAASSEVLFGIDPGDLSTLTVYQNGLMLVYETHYTIKTDKTGITLVGYQGESGDIFTFVCGDITGSQTADEIQKGQVTATQGQSTITIPITILSTEGLTVFENGIMITEGLQYTATTTAITLIGYTADAGDVYTFMSNKGLIGLGGATDASMVSLNSTKFSGITNVQTALESLNDKFSSYLTASSASSTYLPKTGGTLTGHLTTVGLTLSAPVTSTSASRYFCMLNGTNQLIGITPSNFLTAFTGYTSTTTSGSKSLRNIMFKTSAPTSSEGSNGDICIVYAT